MKFLSWPKFLKISKKLKNQLSSQDVCSLTTQEMQQVVKRLFEEELERRNGALKSSLPEISRNSSAWGSLESAPDLTILPSDRVLLGEINDETLFKKPHKVYLNPDNGLGHIGVYGGYGCGKTEILLALARNETERGRKVFCFFGKGDNALFAQASSHLADLRQTHALRVVNLMTKHDGQDKNKGYKYSHSWDLFDGFTQDMLKRFMLSYVSMITEKQAIEEVVDIVAYIVFEYAREHKKRIRPSMLDEAIGNPLSLLNSLASKHGLRDQWFETLSQINLLQQQLLGQIREGIAILWKDFGHIFDSETPQVSLAEFMEVDAPRFMLVLAPSLEKNSQDMHFITQALALCIKENVEHGKKHHGRFVFVLNDAEYFAPQTQAVLSRVQKQNVCFVWGYLYPPKKEKLLSYHWKEPATHIAMRCLDIDGTQEFLTRQRAIYPDFAFPSAEDLAGFREGEALVWNESGIKRIVMDCKPTKFLHELYLHHLPFLNEPGYLNETPKTVVNLSRACGVFQKRWDEYCQKNTISPTLAWCQETLAQMLGFSSLHEANKALGRWGELNH